MVYLIYIKGGVRMELKQIEYFLQLAQTGHVSKTAGLLDISQPTLSRSLSRLEHSLGVSLFDRVGSQIRLNASGQRFYEYAKQAMQLLDTGTLVAKKSAYEISGNVSIACRSFAPILIPCIREYMALNPLVNIQVFQYNHNVDTTPEQDYDFMLSSAQDRIDNNENSQGWVTQPLFTEESLFVIGPKHPQFNQLNENEDRIDLSCFSDACFVTMRIDKNFVDYTYDICQSAGFFPKSYFQTDNFLVKMTVIREGIAVGFLPESCLMEAMYLCPGLRPLHVNHCNICRTMLMMRKKKNLLSEASLDFWNFLLDHYELPSDTRN